MGIEGLRIIGESINDSIPSTNKLFAAGDFNGILELAKTQDAGGAHWIDCNIGRRPPEFMAEMVGKIQSVTAKPLSIDTPDLEIAKAGLAAYNPGKANGGVPILNSISLLRLDMFSIYAVRPFMPILLASERVEEGRFKANHTAEETWRSARELLKAARDSVKGIANDAMIVDVGIGPIGSDTEGMLKRVLDSIGLIHRDPDFKGIHLSVGLSNFTHMLPAKRADGSPVRAELESAFLTLAMPLGLDTIIGSVNRKYEILPAGHPALECLGDLRSLDGVEAVERVRDFYAD